MYEIIMEIDGKEYVYGRSDNRDRANQIAIEVRENRGVDTYVCKTE